MNVSVAAPGSGIVDPSKIRKDRADIFEVSAPGSQA
jgi:hypothetical protein